MTDWSGPATQKCGRTCSPCSPCHAQPATTGRCLSPDSQGQETMPHAQAADEGPDWPWAFLTALERALHSTAIPCLYWANGETLFCTASYCMVVRSTTQAGSSSRSSSSTERCDNDASWVGRLVAARTTRRLCGSVQDK